MDMGFPVVSTGGTERGNLARAVPDKKSMFTFNVPGACTEEVPVPSTAQFEARHSTWFGLGLRGGVVSRFIVCDGCPWRSL